MVAKKKTAKKESSKKSGESIFKNYWAVAALVLAILLVLSLTLNSPATGSVSAETAAENLVEFAESQGASAEVVEVNDEGQFYEVVLSIEGQNLPLYVTKDGKSFTQQIIEFEESSETPATPSTPSEPAPTNVPQTAKPEVELFVMSICPYGTQAEKGIIPVVDLLGDKIDFKLRFVSYAMHDLPEVDENTVQYCIQQEEPEKLTEYLSCYLEENDPTTWDACIDSVGINRAAVESCVDATNEEYEILDLYADKSTWSGGRFPMYPVEADLNTQYGVRGSPTLVINGVQSNAGRSASSYLAGICAAFTDAPEECSEDLSSLGNPGPGFGFDAQGGAAAAGCGI